ncbi:MAG: inorganic phosphate transporter [Bacteroidales bacterium]|nr:inorganic phosphate transporter [Bacteroidales bacterium]
MENFYLFLVIVLFGLAISDLIVGVSNDAVNFLNSAVGSKAAPYKIIMMIAALGVLVGATFSSGMMEVARKGIFHPSQFYFSEILIIFLAVMVTDVILLDLFNTFGMPTSTTVSIIFELLGASVAISIIKITAMGDPMGTLGNYINTGKALAIISGILISVVVAFSVGAIIQYFTRMLFTFRYKEKMGLYGALWGGMAITAITYFLLIKGAKGSSFISTENYEWIKGHTWLIIGMAMLTWTLLLQILIWVFKINVLKITVLVGTFALAMAFAGNDLVNFIGVPLAGLKAFQTFISNPGADPTTFGMEALGGEVQTNTWILLVAGFVMVATLWFSKKARSVLRTTVDLSRQDEGSERFGSSAISRMIVRGTRNMSGSFSNLLPMKFRNSIENRFQPYTYPEKNDGQGKASFDMLRASVNLVVSSILIAMGTSLKLPLSTTYVTFMVAMGTSLSDRAWGRESAVYRVTGVLSVIGGWFFTALAAFTVALCIAFVMHYGGTAGIIAAIVITILLVLRTHHIHLRKEALKETEKNLEQEAASSGIVKECTANVISTLHKTSLIFDKTMLGIIDENLAVLKEARKEVKKLNEITKKYKYNIQSTIVRLQGDMIDGGFFYVQVLDYLREIAHCITYINNPAYDHMNNDHKPMLQVQKEELMKLKSDMQRFFEDVLFAIENNRFDHLDQILLRQTGVIDVLRKTRKAQIKRIKSGEAGTRNSVLYLNILTESKNLLLNTINLYKSQRDFILEKQAPDSIDL